MQPTSRPSFLEITQCLEGVLQHQLGVEGAGATLFSIRDSLPAPGTAPALNGTWVSRGVWGAPSPPQQLLGSWLGWEEVCRTQPRFSPPRLLPVLTRGAGGHPGHR